MSKYNFVFSPIHLLSLFCFTESCREGRNVNTAFFSENSLSAISIPCQKPRVLSPFSSSCSGQGQVPVARGGQKKRTSVNRHRGWQLGSWGCRNCVFKREGWMGAVKRWGDSFERECQVIWEKAKKLNGDRASSAGKTALDESQATKAALLTSVMFLPQVLLSQGFQSFLTFSSHSTIHLPSLVCLLEPPV